MEIGIEKPRKLDGRIPATDCCTRICTYGEAHGVFRHLHCHDYIEILFGKNGEALVRVSEDVIPLRSGDLIIIHEHVGHDVITMGEPAVYHIIKFLPTLLQASGDAPAEFRYVMPFWERHDDPGAPFFAAERLKKTPIPRLIDEIMEEWQTRPYGYELLIQSNLQRIIVELLRASGACENRKESITPSLRLALETVLAETGEHLADWTAEKAAKSVYLSYPYFSRSFKRVYGLSFSSYLEALRFREAERLLLLTDTSISEIATGLGFATPAYFTERFHRRYGMPPRLFRRCNRTSTVKDKE